MPRIRTIKPELARHRGLFDLEAETGLPLRFVWAMLPCVCDREGRFRWRPWDLKLDILPYDQIDFGRVLDVLAAHGYLIKYRNPHSAAEDFLGCIPTFTKHQSVNLRESNSVLPSPESCEQIDSHPVSAVDQCVHEPEQVNARGEGKGKEGNIYVLTGSTSLGFELEQIYSLYPKRSAGKQMNKATGMKSAMKKFIDPKKAARLLEAVQNLKRAVESGKQDREYIQMWSSFVNAGWENWLGENLEGDEHLQQPLVFR